MNETVINTLFIAGMSGQAKSNLDFFPQLLTIGAISDNSSGMPMAHHINNIIST